MAKAQTSTEYIILVAVVIVIAVVVASILGDFPGIGSSSSKNIDNYKLTTGKIAVDDYANFTDYSLIKIRNNHFDTLVAKEVWINDNNCSSSNPSLPLTLNIGQSINLNCSGITFVGIPEIYIVWEDVMGASYAQGSDPGIITDDVNCPNNEFGFFDGDGSESDPFQICNWEQLANINTSLSSNYILVANLSISTFGYSDYASPLANDGKGWKPIGINYTHSFRGDFVGGRNYISKLSINRPDENYVGLFGYVYEAEILNLGLRDFEIIGGNFTGALSGYFHLTNLSHINVSSTINGGYENVGGIGGYGGYVIGSNLSFVGRVEGSYQSVGGLFGFTSRNGLTDSYVIGNITGVWMIGGLIGSVYPPYTLDESYFVGNIFADRSVGGLIGQESSAISTSPITISNSFSKGVIEMTGGQGGGLVGYLARDDIIINSYSNVNITGSYKLGGLLGSFYTGGQIINSYSSGLINNLTNTLNSGGAIATIVSGSASNLFWDIETSNQTISALGTGKTTSQMKQQSTFTGWNIAPIGSHTSQIWYIDEGNDYPRLWWEKN